MGQKRVIMQLLKKKNIADLQKQMEICRILLKHNGNLTIGGKITKGTEYFCESNKTLKMI